MDQDQKIPPKPSTDPLNQAPSPNPSPSQEPTYNHKNKRRGSQIKVTQQQREQIEKLHRMEFGTRRIATMVGLGRKVVRRVLEQMGHLKSKRTCPPPPSTKTTKATSKLDPFRQQIQEKVNKQLTITRTLREIRQAGYTGGRSVLADYVRKIRTQPTPVKRVWRRFETEPGKETQFDWSPYRVPLGGKERTVHAFGATLGFSRKSYLRFYMNERESTLLEAHTLTFADFEGVTKRGVYDRMATVVLGTVGKEQEPLWHPRFLEFAHYYGYEPFLCQVADPDRKGKDERLFLYLERDFLQGSEFESLEDLNAKARLWLDEIANCRVHGTTRRIPNEAWEQEKPFLIPLPQSRYPACDEELRDVGPDAVLSVRGTPYTVPGHLAHKTVSVRLYAEHFEVLNPFKRPDEVAFTRRYVPESEKGRLVIDSTHYEGVRRRSHIPTGSMAKLEDAFLKRFGGLAELVDGIKRRMKGLSHIHLRALWRLADRYGEEAFIKAATRVQTFRRFDAQAVRRILERDHPLVDEEPIETPLTSSARVLLELGDVDPGSLDDYAHLDHQMSQDSEPQQSSGHGSLSNTLESDTEGSNDDE